MIKRIAKKILNKLKKRDGISSDFEGFIKIKDSISKNNFEMYLRKDSYMEREFADYGLYGNWEKESLKIWAHLSRKSNNIIDIGANTGVFSLIAKNNNPKAQVFSIEPIDINFDILSRNIKRNGFLIHAEKVAFSDKVGTAKMFMLKDRLNYMTSVNDNRYALHPEIQGETEVIEIEVPITTYDNIKSKYQIPQLDLIKIDVEGHEVDVLRSMYDVIKKEKPIILIEVIGDENAVELNNMFKELGYKFISMDEINTSVVVDHLWDNDHHNFLLCNDDVIKDLKSAGLVK